MYPTRLALVATLLLAALAAAQWFLNSVAQRPSAADASAQPSVAAEPVSGPTGPTGPSGRAREPQLIDEPVIEIPEYVPEPVVERPRTPVEFGEHEIPLDLGLPSVVGGDAGATREPTTPPL